MYHVRTPSCVRILVREAEGLEKNSDRIKVERGFMPFIRVYGPEDGGRQEEILVT
jgi:hypothetical protein